MRNVLRSLDTLASLALTGQESSRLALVSCRLTQRNYYSSSNKLSVKVPAQKQLALLRGIDEALGRLGLQGVLARGKYNNEGERFWGLIVKLLGNIKVFSKFMENI